MYNSVYLFLKIIMLFSTFLLVLGTMAGGLVQVDDNRARAVYEELDRRLNAVTYETATLQMRIVDSRGRVREREMVTWSYSRGDESKTLVRFNSPADVRGTGFLNISDGTSEVQRLFLPALNRVQTISASQRGDRFMGSDFTYEDMGDQKPDDFDFSVLESNDADGYMLIEGIRKTSATYKIAHFKIDTNRYVLLEASYFDERGEVIRRLVAGDVTEIRSGIWRANKLTMQDVKANRYTELIWKSRTIDEPIDDVIFTERNLSRF
jgi:hypothetical protein